MSSKLQKTVRFCGSCQHYCWTLGPQRKTTCNNLGSIEITPSCTDYSINPFVLQDFEKVLKPLADVLRVMPITTLSMFYEIISQEKGLRRKGFYFMEKVAIKYWGTPAERFVSNYVTAHVYSADKEGVFLITKSGIRMYALRDSVVKLDFFLELRKELRSVGKIVDPTLSSRASAKQRLAVTETLDDIIARGMIDADELDSELKRKLNPKRISRDMHDGIKATELSMSTKKKPSDADQYKMDTRDTIKEKIAKKKKGKKEEEEEPEPAVSKSTQKRDLMLTSLKKKMGGKNK